jgi:2-amino-4-hydroxy-6-hydroxymethyldihydropteridine diphosphokinase
LPDRWGWKLNEPGITRNKQNEALPHNVYISLGSNVNPEINLVKAIQLLINLVEIEAYSHVWETPPFGTTGHNFLNAVIKITTNLDAESLKATILRPVETVLGRVRTTDKFAPRTIDLDILLFDDKLVESNLWKHAFLAVPFAELYPGYTRPLDFEPINAIAEKLAQKTPMRRLDLSLTP